jgi:hypothetical protein
MYIISSGVREKSVGCETTLALTAPGGRGSIGGLAVSLAALQVQPHYLYFAVVVHYLARFVDATQKI